MDDAFGQGFPEPDEGTQAQYDLAKSTISKFVMAEGTDWFQINASGHAAAEEPEGDRPHISIGVMPVATPYGMAEAKPTGEKE